MNVIKIGGAVLAADSTAQTIAKSWHDDPQPLVIIHGGGPQLDEALRAIDGEPQKIDGLRVTSAAAANAAAETMDGLGLALAHALNELGVPATHIGSDTGCFQAVVKDDRLGRVGTVTDVVTAPIRHALRRNGVAIVTPVGQDAIGPLNVNADEGACVAAMTLRADAMLLATDVPAVLDADGKPITQVTDAEMEHLIASGVVKGGMVPKVRNAMEAISAGVHVIIGHLGTTQGTRIVPAIEVTA